jgi:NAD-dependent deacetylase
MQDQDLLIKPNAAHYKLVELEKAGKLKAIITQNIDTLHQDAGSKVVHQIHGTIATNHCVKCNKAFSLKDILNSSGVAKCDCGGIIKPDVVLYNEGLPRATWIAAEHAARNADMLIIAGTSLVVYPAASLLDYFRGDKLVILNLQETEADSMADLVIHKDMKDIFEKIIVR